MPNNKPTQDEKTFGAIANLWVFSILILIMKKDSEFVKFHARQGIVLFLITIILGWIPVLGWILVVIASLMMLYGAYKAATGEQWEMPVIGPIAKKINL